MISSLHPATAHELGFEASIRAAIAPFPAARAVQLIVNSTVDDRTLAVALPLRIAQELTVNAVKHARPRQINVLVTREADQIVLEVNDDGVGIDSSDATRAVQAGHVGLAMVRRRVEDSGGRFEIETRPTAAHVRVSCCQCSPGRAGRGRTDRPTHLESPSRPAPDSRSAASKREWPRV